MVRITIISESVGRSFFLFSAGTFCLIAEGYSVVTCLRVEPLILEVPSACSDFNFYSLVT